MADFLSHALPVRAVNWTTPSPVNPTVYSTHDTQQYAWIGCLAIGGGLLTVGDNTLATLHSLLQMCQYVAHFHIHTSCKPQLKSTTAEALIP